MQKFTQIVMKYCQHHFILRIHWHTAVTHKAESKDTCDKKDEDNHSLGNYLLKGLLGERKSPSPEYILCSISP